MKTSTTASGKLIVERNETVYLGDPVGVHIYHNFGIIQIGHGDRYLPPIKLLSVGEQQAYLCGDFEITIKRARKSRIVLVDERDARAIKLLNK